MHAKRRPGRDGQIYLTGRSSDRQRPTATIGHMHQLEVAGALDKLHGEVRQAAIANCAVSDGIRPRLGRRHNLGKAAIGARAMRRQHHGRGAE